MAETFVGRETELRALAQLMQTARLCTVLGTGGVGKSALVMEHKRRTDLVGPAFCDLSMARTEEDVCRRVAQTLSTGLAIAGERATRINALGDALAACGTDITLVLDDAEAVAKELGPLCESWLARAPNARILITSRVRIGARNEHVLVVEPLALASSAGPSDAAKLFVLRARAAGAAVNDTDLHAVESLVHLLDGLPLAIELMAARARLFPVAVLLTRLTSGAELSGDEHTGDNRHSTMRGVVAGSFALLEERDREALLSFACFRGGFSIDAAEAMLGPDGLFALTRLADASLVRSVTTRDGAARFDLFQSVRASATERMKERAGHERALFLAHAAHMANAAVGFRKNARATGGIAWLLSLDREHDNLVTALLRLLTPGTAPDNEAIRLALVLAVELEPIRLLRGHAATYAEWLLATLALASRTDASAPDMRQLVLRATLCHARALLELGLARESRKEFGRALALAVAAADAVHEAHALCGIARLDAHAGEWQRALDVLADAKLCAIRSNDQALLHMILANESFHGSELHDGEEELGHLERAAAFFKADGDERESLYWTVQLGRAYTDFDRQERALARLEDASARARAIGDRRTEGLAAFGLGGAYLSRAQLDLARTAYARAAAILGEVGKERERGYALGYLGAVEHLRGRMDDAESAYMTACATLTSVGDAPNATLFSLFLAGLLADVDRSRESAASLGRANAGVAAANGSGMRTVVAKLSRAMLESCLARAALQTGDLDGFMQHRRDADACLRVAESRPVHVESARTTYDWRDVSLDVRVAFRLAQRAVLAVSALQLPAGCVVVAGACARVRPRTDAPWIELQRRHALRRIMVRLVDAQKETPGAVVVAADLITAGWPDEQIAQKAAMNRLHVALGTLRHMGLGAVLEHQDQGWRLAPHAPVLRVAEDWSD